MYLHINGTECMPHHIVLLLDSTTDENHHYIIEEIGATVVRRIFSEYHDGHTMTAIAKGLNEDGYRNSRGRDFSVNNISNILGNEKYIGNYVYGDLEHPDAFPAIIDKHLFYEVQDKLKNNIHQPKTNTQEEYLLSGKLVCGVCGEKMIGESGTARDKSLRRYYKCKNRKFRLNTCDNAIVKKDFIEDVVFKIVLERLQDDGIVNIMVDGIMKSQEQENPEVASLKNELSSINRKINNVTNAIAETSDSTALVKKLKELECAKKNLEDSISRLKDRNVRYLREEVSYWFRRFVDGTVKNDELRRTIFRQLVNTVVWQKNNNDPDDDGEITVTINYPHTSGHSSEHFKHGSVDAQAVPPKQKHPNGCFCFGALLNAKRKPTRSVNF